MSRWILFAALLAMLPMPAIAAGLDDARAGLAAQSRGDLDAAIEFYAKAIESGELGRKHTVFALNNLGLAYDTQGEHDDAIISFNAAIQLMPDYHCAYFNRGISFASLGEYDEAIADYDRAIELDPSDPDIVKRRADAYLARDEHELAIRDYDVVIERSPNNPRALKGRATAYMMAGHYDDAIADYDAALTIDPDDAELARSRTLALQAKEAAPVADDTVAEAQSEPPAPLPASAEPTVEAVAPPVVQAAVEPAPTPPEPATQPVVDAVSEPAVQPAAQMAAPPPAPAVVAPPAAPEPVVQPVVEAPAAAPEPVVQPVVEAPAAAPELVVQPVVEAPAAAPEPVVQPVVEAPAAAPEPVAETDVAAAPASQPVPETPVVTVIDEPMDELLRTLYDRSATAFEGAVQPAAETEPQPLVVASAPAVSAPEPAPTSAASIVPSLVLPAAGESESEFVTDDPNYYILRGNSYKNDGLYNRAIADYDTAVRLDPDLPASYNNRGVAYGKLGMHQRAIDDYDIAIRLNSNDFVAFKNRGNAHFYLGDFGVAARDFETLADDKPSDAYRMIWLYLAQARSGAGDVSALTERAGRINTGAWPGPVIEMLLGESTPAVVLDAARQVALDKRAEQECEAYFYLGQYHLIAGNIGEAQRMFQLSVDTGVTNFIEYTGSEAELKRLTQSQG